jgi:hypothetical protein
VKIAKAMLRIVTLALLVASALVVLWLDFLAWRAVHPGAPKWGWLLFN